MANALSTSLKLLTRRQLTTEQLASRLKRKGFLTEQIEDAVNTLKEWKYLDDEYYALTLCKMKKEKSSRLKIFHELLEAGVAEDLIHTVLDQCYPEYDEVRTCERLAQKILEQESDKWQRKYQYNDRYKQIPQDLFVKKKTGEKLSRQGYPYHVIKQVLDII